jgi:glycosyltransferase involved in cell wall biosynthesis
VLLAPLSVIRRRLASPAGLASIAAAAARDAIALRALIRRRRVALVHSNTSVVLSGAAAAAAAGVPHVWHVREIYSGFPRAWPAFRRALLTARALPCVSHAAAAQFGPDRRVSVIPDGLAIDPSRPARGPAREALGIDPEAPAIAVVGRISDWKGQDLLVRALASPRLRQRGVLGLVAGDPWPSAERRRDAVVALARELGVAERLLLLGFRDDVANVYGAADLVAIPSTAPDPLPGAAIEAAASGCAVLAAAHGGLPEIVRDGETGRLFAPGDAGAFAAAAAELLDDPERCAALGAAAARDVRERFAPERLAPAVQALYGELLRS